MAIHGNKSQTARTKALADFKKGELQVLVATDIAARGIDIDQLPHVVNFEHAERARGLRAPDRPHRPRRLAGRGDLARLRRRERLPARHRAADPARDPEGDRPRLRAAVARAARADRARPHGDRRRREPRRRRGVAGAPHRNGDRTARRARAQRPGRPGGGTARRPAAAARPPARDSAAGPPARPPAAKRTGPACPPGHAQADRGAHGARRRQPGLRCWPAPPAWSAGPCSRLLRRDYGRRRGAGAARRRPARRATAPCRPAASSISRACPRRCRRSTTSTSPSARRSRSAGSRGGVSRRRLRRRGRDGAPRARSRRDPARRRLGARRRARLARLLQPRQGRDAGRRRRARLRVGRDRPALAPARRPGRARPAGAPRRGLGGCACSARRCAWCRARSGRSPPADVAAALVAARARRPAPGVHLAVVGRTCRTRRPPPLTR